MELRKDPIIGQWVAVHTNNSWTPEQYTKRDRRDQNKETCQFCPGKEHLTPPEVFSIEADGQQSQEAYWQARVVPNKFPALKIEGDIDPRSDGLFEMSNGVGAHEVLIETPSHDRDLTDLSIDEFANVIKSYQARLIDLTKDKRFKYIAFFRNYGAEAGATVQHPHSQIIALPMIPKYVLEELEGMRDYYNQNQRCVFCDIIKQEINDQDRIILQNDEFISFCPFVPRYPFESWILPKEHTVKFKDLEGASLESFVEIFQGLLKRLKNCLSDPAYNYYLHLSPINTEESFSIDFHWHVEIVPKLRPVAGFEWGTGFYLVHTAPHLAAQYLRNA